MPYQRLPPYDLETTLKTPKLALTLKSPKIAKFQIYLKSSVYLCVLLDLPDVERPDPDDDVDPLRRLHGPLHPLRLQLLVPRVRPRREHVHEGRGLRDLADGADRHRGRGAAAAASDITAGGAGG